MLTDMTPTAGQLYGSQIPTMGMNITNIATHLQKPTVNPVSTKMYVKETIIFQKKNLQAFESSFKSEYSSTFFSFTNVCKAENLFKFKHQRIAFN